MLKRKQDNYALDYSLSIYVSIKHDRQTALK